MLKQLYVYKDDERSTYKFIFADLWFSHIWRYPLSGGNISCGMGITLIVS